MHATVPVVELLGLSSGEATLICAAGHIAGHPHWCAAGCMLRPGTTVADVIACKDPAGGLARLDQPVSVEEGWLIDGHHRVARAVAFGIAQLPVQFVTGILTEQRAWHSSVAQQCHRLAAGLDEALRPRVVGATVTLQH